MLKHACILILATTTLVACQAGPKVSGARGDSTRFECTNGLSVQVRQLDQDRIELRLDEQHAVLSAAVTGSGERYVSDSGLFGHGAEWHRKGGQAMLNFVDPYGNAVETDCQAKP